MAGSTFECLYTKSHKTLASSALNAAPLNFKPHRARVTIIDFPASAIVHIFHDTLLLRKHNVYHKVIFKVVQCCDGEVYSYTISWYNRCVCQSSWSTDVVSPGNHTCLPTRFLSHFMSNIMYQSTFWYPGAISSIVPHNSSNTIWTLFDCLYWTYELVWRSLVSWYQTYGFLPSILIWVFLRLFSFCSVHYEPTIQM